METSFLFIIEFLIRRLRVRGCEISGSFFISMSIEYNFNILDLLFPVIYKITIGTHQYIGSTKRCAKVRIQEHIRLLIHGKHYNSIMQN